MVVPIEIRQAFQVKYVSKLNTTLAQKNFGTGMLSNPVPENLDDKDYQDIQEITDTMLETFKYYLEGIKNSNLNIRERSLFEKIIDCPVDTETMGKLPLFFKDSWNEFRNVMVGGH